MRAHRVLALAAVVLLGCATTYDDDDDDAVSNDDDSTAAELSPPGAMTIAIAPAAPTSSDSFSVVVVSTAEDPDGDLAGTRYSWRVDDAARADLDGVETIGADQALRGETWEVTAIPYDATGLEGPPAVAEVTVQNSPPGAPGIAITPPAPVGGADPLICVVEEASQDADGDVVTYTLQWDVDGATYPLVVHAGPTTTFEDGDTVPAGDSVPGQLWTCRVTPADGTDDGLVATVQVTTGEPLAMPDFGLLDVNATSATFGQVVSPRDYLESVSGWYFGHAT
jgi:hypothetical protein